jgi:hypothetical protein
MHCQLARKFFAGDRIVLKRLGVLVVLLLPSTLMAQSPRSAVGGDGVIWAGAEASDFNPDYSCPSNMVFNCKYDLLGVTGFFDVNVTRKIGAEGEARWLEWNGRGSESESNYLIGPRYRFYRHGRYSFWAKGMIGGGWITTPFYPQAGSLKGSYFAIAPGVTVDYRVSRHFLVRADYEYEFWPSFAGPPTYGASGNEELHNSGLTPNGLSVGVAWRIFNP